MREKIFIISLTVMTVFVALTGCNKTGDEKTHPITSRVKLDSSLTSPTSTNSPKTSRRNTDKMLADAKAQNAKFEDLSELRDAFSELNLKIDQMESDLFNASTGALDELINIYSNYTTNARTLFEAERSFAISNTTSFYGSAQEGRDVLKTINDYYDRNAGKLDVKLIEFNTYLDENARDGLSSSETERISTIRREIQEIVDSVNFDK